MAIFFLYLSLSFSAITLFTFEGLAVKPYHIVALTLLPGVVLRMRRRRAPVPWPPLLFLFYALLASLAVWLFLGGFLADTAKPNPLWLNYAFALYLFLLGWAYGKPSARRPLFLASLAMALAVGFKLLGYASELADYLEKPYAHPELFWFYGGGPNLEASWLVASAAFALGTPLFWPLWLGVLAVAGLYASRAALVLAVALAVAALLGRGGWRIAARAVLLGVIVVGVVAELNPYALNRFRSLGYDPGSATRLELWQGALAAFESWPLGYGAGNALAAVEEVTSVPYREDNVHNYYLQVALDFGLPGLLLWLWAVAWAAKRFRGFRGPDPIGTFVLLYLIGALVQYRGADPLFWLVLGLLAANGGRRG